MKKKGLKQAKRRLIIYIFIFLGGCVFVCFTTFKTWIQIIDNKTTVAKLNSQYDKLLEQEKQLKSDVNKLQDPDYVARYAREKYLYTKDGELIIRMPKEN